MDPAEEEVTVTDDTEGISSVVDPPTAQAVRHRLHPCIVQYKTCRFKDKCLLKEYPGNTCINYFNGSCIYGADCARLHTVDGVDIRASQRPQEPTTILSGSTAYRITARVPGSKVLLAVKNEEAGEERESDAACGLPKASAFNRIRGSQPTHTDPHVSTHATTSGGTAKPSPFLDLAKRLASNNTASFSLDASLAAEPKLPPKPEHVLATRRHPCVAQFGSCKFGEACHHADRDADVCVHFLNGRCRFDGDTCYYRHETQEEYTRAICDRRGKHLALNSGDGTTPVAAKEKSRAGRDAVAGPDRQSCDTMQRELTDAYLGEAPVSCSFDEDGADATIQGKSTGDREAAVAANPQNDEELQVFLCLLEAFPDVDPMYVAQALRSAGGDTELVADALAKVSCLMTPESVDAALAAVLEEEEQELEESRWREIQSKDECMLTLCTLFPSVEPGTIEAVLSSSGTDFADAYERLLCSQEKLAQGALPRKSGSGKSLSGKLQTEKLCKMFSSVHKDIVRAAYDAAEGNVNLAAQALNHLLADLHSPQELDHLTSKSMRWRPHAGVSNRAAASAGVPPSDIKDSQPPVESRLSDMKEVEREVQRYGDWRRVRQQAYMINTLRIHVQSQATAAYLHGDSALAKTLSRHGRQLGDEYTHLNRLVMLSLEHERLRSDPVSTLDLHGFHVEEALQVLRRRVELCRTRCITRLTVIVGKGLHSKGGRSTIYPAVLDSLSSDAYFTLRTRKLSVKQDMIILRVLLPDE